jgi:hypothetical protein
MENATAHMFLKKHYPLCVLRYSGDPRMAGERDLNQVPSELRSGNKHYTAVF